MTSKEFHFHEKIIVRTPAYPLTLLFNAGGGTRDLDEVINLLLNDDIFMEGIYWSSPQLYQTIIKYKTSHDKTVKTDKLLFSLKKYAIRACSRCTPYGTFAGCGIKSLLHETPDDYKGARRKARIDMALLNEIKKTIEATEEIKLHLRYSINNTLYKLPGQYRFLEAVNESGKLNYQVSSIEQNNIIENLVEYGKDHVLTFKSIKNLLRDDFEETEVEEFVNNLIETQFLLSELQLSLTADDGLLRYKKILCKIEARGIQHAKEFVYLISTIEDVLQKLNTTPLGKIPLIEIEQLKIKLHESGVSNIPEHLFHVDLLNHPPKGVNFLEQELNEIETAIKILGKLSAPVTLHEKTLQRFKKTFTEKYETQAVSLLEVLDPETGIGFPVQENVGDVAHNAFIGNITAMEKHSSENVSLDKATLWLQEKIDTPDIFSLLNGVELLTSDLTGFQEKTNKLPNQFSVMGTKMPNGMIFLQSVGGACANGLLGRFAYMDSSLDEFCTYLSVEEKENNPDVVFADIVHIPEGRTGNIARRIRLCEYEIPILCSPNKEQQTIYLNDLSVSVRNDEIVLYSKSLEKRVIPRLNNAHNHQKSIVPAYKFLSAIQHQQKVGLNINWGILENRKRFLPRIAYKNIILHRATWILHTNDVETIKKSKDPLFALKDFFKKWMVPRYVIIAESDNELFIDINNDNYLQIVMVQMHKYGSLKFIEWLQGEALDGCINSNPLFANQFIMSLSKNNIVPIPSFRNDNKDFERSQRSFAPGSEWLYFKIYCSAFASDIILISVVEPAIQSLLEYGIIKKAFFVRYKDPHYHIRFRILLAKDDDRSLVSQTIEQVRELLTPLMDDRSVWKVQLDTYEREIERYGKSNIEVSESVFFHDSLLFLNILEDIAFVEDDEIRFMLGIKNVDRWLSLFNMDTAAKYVYCEKMAKGLAFEFGKDIRLQFDTKYRQMKGNISNFMLSNNYDDYFSKRDNYLIKFNLPEVNLPSYIHMSQNRWFVTQQRLMEYMVYEFCSRYYDRLLHEKPK